MKRTVTLILSILLISLALSAMTFSEYLKTAYEKGDGRRDLELKNRYEVWASRADLAGILPRVDFEFTLPSYRNSVDEYEGLGEVFENEYLSYGGTAVVNQVLPSNTELSATFSYVDYQTYKYYGEEIEGGYKAGQLVFSARQYIWGSNTGYHRMKLWLNSRKEEKINCDENILAFFKTAYSNYIDYLTILRGYELNKGQLERYRDIFRATENSYKMGLTDLITYNRIKKRYVFLEMALKESEMQLKEADKKMRLYLNGPFEDPVKSVLNIDFALFKDARPDTRLVLQKIKLDNAYRAYKMGKKQYEPVLFGELAATYTGGGVSSMGSLERDNYTLSLVLSIPFANLVKVSGLKIAKIDYLMEKNRYQDEMETIQISFEKLMTQLEITREKIDLFKNILPTLKENYRSSLSRFNIGAITLQELMDIEDEYISAELEYLNLLKNYNLTALEISSYVGNAQAIVEELL